MTLPGARRSYWLDSARAPEHPPLDGDVSADVCVVGGGIFGVTVAHLLQREGKSVVLVDRKRIGHGVTGYTTAKVTSAHGLIYETLVQKFGEDGARLYGAANEEGIDLLEEIATSNGIDCDLVRTPHVVYAESQDKVGSLREEADTAARLGLPATFTTDTELPYPVAAAVRFHRQIGFHPLKYLFGVAGAFAAAGGRIFENTIVKDVNEAEPCEVITDGGVVRARDVVIATHIPILDRGLFFAKAHPYRSYAIAGPVAAGAAPEAMYISADDSTRSIRNIPAGDRTLLLVGGEGHKVGHHEDTRRCYLNLAEWARERFGVEAEYRWSAQDYSTVDKIPYVGAMTRRSDHLFTATGFAKWGLANGTISAAMVRDLIVGRPNRYLEVFDANRLNITGSASEFIKENVNVARRFFADRLAALGHTLDEVGPGEAKVLGKGVDAVAVYKDDDGDVHAVSAVCSHMGCVVAWNHAETTWDCPCHGSRFTCDGDVIQGPAIEPLTTKTL